MTVTDVITLFFTIFAAVTISLVFVLKLYAKRISRDAGYNYMRGRKEFMNDEEQQYRRKPV